ncbi:tRNA pseudouridine(13) synthase TruD [Steroidobacter sp.]|uniref:tRNA pseudouridine(13) synthase TruD n=1 Tax=Steroidobacter sp. TaxID=1978227 RepID=UPI001A389B47|nr:tRNA pseudouridine(13) synthase TruD [Steroidobacter sp.]MBL8269604.1 tRNA pseudouridine(13) synthase TruD [Steroidobacter sp.]
MNTVELINLPCAHGGPAGSARLRAAPEDFLVREWLGFEADGDGDHLLLKVRKRGANTMWVAKQLARIGKIQPRDVGFAGLKDRDAVAEQAFTVPGRSAVPNWLGVTGDGFEVIDAARTRRKLKRGALKGNDFVLVLRDFVGDVSLLEQRLQTLAAQGVPNYFGPQRFGHNGNNVTAAVAWFEGGPAPERAERGFALSAARSVIFNAVLAERIHAGTWNQLLDGDVVNLNGSGSIFVPEAIDDTLRDRCQQLDVHPTGPMWHGEPLATTGAIAALEARIGQQHAVLATGLSKAKLEPERRPLRVPVRELVWRIEGADVHLQFRLQRGSFATAVLHELIDNAFQAETPEADV